MNLLSHVLRRPVTLLVAVGALALAAFTAALVAAIVGAGVAVRMFWGRIKGVFTGQRPVGDEDDDI